ncbi:MAG: hypothetical protein BWY52_02726 [Chloroflexi bacterium ADurb.Bin325]|nr:MAG: hypothetical protein BWY52_02726 [Chloroflexi bacterium ADurb.Bin325]
MTWSPSTYASPWLAPTQTPCASSPDGETGATVSVCRSLPGSPSATVQTLQHSPAAERRASPAWVANQSAPSFVWAMARTLAPGSPSAAVMDCQRPS